MRTTKIALFYKITKTEVVAPLQKELARKDEWLQGIQRMVEADWKPLIVKVVYELFNPEIANQRRFFEGACVDYYAIQNSDVRKGEISASLHRQYREEILDEMLGYDYKTVNKVLRMRKSTTDFKDVQAWNTFLKTLEETLFESAGYEFPNSEHFWELAKVHGYDEARRIAREELQRRLIKKHE
jgi:hypothetical protein